MENENEILKILIFECLIQKASINELGLIAS